MRELDVYRLKSNLVYFREKNGFTQKDIAEKLNLTRQRFNKIENEPQKIKITLLNELAKIYDCNIVDFFD